MAGQMTKFAGGCRGREIVFETSLCFDSSSQASESLTFSLNVNLCFELPTMLKK